MSKRKLAAALLVVGALAAACSGSDKKPAPGISGHNASPASGAASSSSTESSSGLTLTVLAAEPVPGSFAFDTGGTESLAGGPVSVTFTNGTTVSQQLMIVRIRDANFASYKAAILAQGAVVATTLGDVAYTSPTVASGKSATDTVDLTAGTYALLSILPTPDGKTFAEHGMLTRLEVTAAGVPTGSGSSVTSASSAQNASGSSSSSSSSGSSASQSSSSSSSSSGTPGSSAGSTSSSSP